MQTKISRFAETIVSLSKKAVAGEPAPAYRPRKEGYVDYVILAVQGFETTGNDVSHRGGNDEMNGTTDLFYSP